MELLAIIDVPGHPICPGCNSRFYRADGDDNRYCPDCRDTPPAYDERLADGFFLMQQDEDD